MTLIVRPHLSEGRPPEGAIDLVDLLRRRAALRPAETAYVFLEDGEKEAGRLSFSQLDRRARCIASDLQKAGMTDQRALLLYPPGLDYIEAFFGCLYAGVTAIPAYPPTGRHFQRLDAILRDSSTQLIMTVADLRDKIAIGLGKRAERSAFSLVATDHLESDDADAWKPPTINPDSLAFLQYTSGSTGTPRGVMVTHANLLANQELIAQSFQHTKHSTLVGWLPLYHDMGLIGNVLQPLYVGSAAVLMSPMAFLEKPIRWLRAISAFRAHTSGAPNFAYDLCVRKVTAEQKRDLDLSSWKIAFSGAEPVRATTLDRFAAAFAECGFRRQSFLPCYGLAEATLVVTAPTRGEPVALAPPPQFSRTGSSTEETTQRTAPPLVGCGHPWPGHVLKIVDPDHAIPVPEGDVGEIWVAGPSVAKGYWGQPVASESAFHARVAGDRGARYLRTGDLGFVERGNLFITGRLKDLIIIRGRNYYPQDFERVLDEEVSELRPGFNAALSITIDEEDVLVVIAEPQRSQLRTLRESGAGALFRKIGEALANECDMAPAEIVLVQPGSIPRTSSGKVRRAECKRRHLDGEFQVLAQTGRDAGPHAAAANPALIASSEGSDALLRDALSLLSGQQRTALVTRFMTSTAAKLLRIPEGDLSADSHILGSGLDSLRAVELKHALDALLGTETPLSLLLSNMTFGEAAAALANLEHVKDSSAPKDADPGAASRLSQGQLAMWTVHQLSPSSVAYNLHLALRIKGSIDDRALRSSVNYLLERHPILRSVYREDGQGVFQTIRPRAAMRGHFSVMPAEGWTEDALREQLRRQAFTPFDLVDGPIFRITFFRQGDSTATLLFCAHHIALDLWSLLLLMKELEAAYRSFSAGRAPSLPDVAAGYQDFVAWQRRYLADPSSEADWTFWRDRLGGGLPALELRTDYPRPAASANLGSAVWVRLDPTLTAALKALARAHGATLFMALFAAYNILLSRYTNQRDIVVGSAATGRSQRRFASVVGNFVNPIAFRNALRPEQSFSEFLRDVRDCVAEGLAHQDFPFSLIVERLQPERVAGQWPIFQTWFALQQAQADVDGEYAQLALGENSAPMAFGDWEVEGLALDERVERFDLKLMAAETRQGVALSFQYRCDLFREETIARLAGGFLNLVEAIVAAPQSPVAVLPLIGARDGGLRRAAAPSTDVVSGHACVHHLFSAWAQKTPNAVALVDAKGETTYAALDAQANQLANYLRAKGVDRNVPVGVCADRSARAIVAILAVLKAGGAYIPIDPVLPPARIAAMVEDAGLLICEEDWHARSGVVGVEAVFLDRHEAAISAEPTAAPIVRNSLLDLAYVIYTSGSTGRPKGVAVTHAGVINYTRAILAQLPAESGLHFALVSTLAADLGNTALFPALAGGGRLHVLTYNEATDPRLFRHYLARRQIDVLKITPSHFSALAPLGDEADILPRRTLLFGGEALPLRLAKPVLAEAGSRQIFNHYGPTETTVGALMLRLSAQQLEDCDSSTVPVGGAIENMRAYVLSPDLALAPDGVIGEICLAGGGLARGYLGRPDLTAERFVPDPCAAQPGERLYRTGDLGRVTRNGVIEFIGRIDRQAKIRGYRVELGEIETLLSQHASVEQAVLAALPDKRGTTRLVAYVVVKRDAERDADLLRAHLRRLLPDYMTPSLLIFLDVLPVTQNGKIDRKRLPQPDIEALSSRAYRAPRDAIEASLAEIYRSLLGVDRVGIDDSFFALGGDSILSIQAASRAHAAGLLLSPREIFLKPSIAELAPTVQSGKAPELPSLMGSHSEDFPLSTLSRWEVDRLTAATPCVEDVYPLTPLQEGLLFHTLSQPNTGVYVMQHRYWIEGEIDVDIFRASWQAIVDAHPIFRTAFVWEGYSQSQQVVHRHVELPFDYLNFSRLSEADQERKLSGLLAEERRAGFDFGKPPLARIRLLRLDDRRYLLIRSHHHILFDAWCTSLILKELQSNYDALSRRQPLPSRREPGFKDYIAWLRRQDEGAAEPFWRDNLAGFSEPTPLVAMRSETVVSEDETAVEDIVLHLSETETAGLSGLAKRFEVTQNTFAQAALALLLAQYTSRPEVLFGVTVSGRPADLPGVESILGLFINALPLRLPIDPDQRLPQFLRSVLERNYAIRDYEYAPLTQVQNWSDLPRGVELFQHLLTFENAPVDQSLLEDCGSWRFTDCWHRTHTNYPITFVVIPGGKLHLQITYPVARVDSASAERLLRHYRHLLKEMIRRPEARLFELSVLDEAERRRMLVEWNETSHSYAEPRDIVGRFEAQAAETPEAVAASCGKASLSYRVLNERVNRLAHALVREDVGPDRVVALLDERGLDFLTMMLAVFKAGAAYLPLDPAHPDGRILQVLEEAQVGLLLAGGAAQDRAAAIVAAMTAASTETKPRILDLAALEARGERSDNPRRRHGPQNLAVVIYTSGSTGKPKGATLEHQGIFNNLITKVPALELTSADVIAQTASQCFDISVWQSLTALTLGARVEIFPDAVSHDPQRLLDEIAARGVTVLEAVPSMIRALLEASEAGGALASLRWLLPCGEAFAPELCRRFMERRPHVRLLNAYGPAECSDDVSYYAIETPPGGDDLSVAIGRPVDNTSLYLLNRWLEPTPVGAPGEICVGGLQVGRGYLNRPELTAAAFLPDPFGPAGARLYRTGDLGRYRFDGNIDFLGRIDHQVKIRGHRIEPGEVEARLATCPGVRAAAVLALPAETGAYRLVAYVVGEGSAVEHVELRRRLRAILPDYMIPSAFVTLDALPLTANGKLDRKALPEPDLNAEIAGSYVAPRTPTGEILAQIWAEVLGLERVSANDNFFEVGGHSLLATRVVSRIRSAFEVALPVRALFEEPTVAALAPRVDIARGRARELAETPPARARRSQTLPMSLAQQRLWFTTQIDGANPLYHFAVAVRITGPLDVEKFAAALNAIVRRHESLRTVFWEESGRLQQKVLSELDVMLHHETLDIVAQDQEENELFRRIRDSIAEPFDLTRGPLVRASIYRVPPRQDPAPLVCTILLCFHHIVFDGWSFGVFLNEFAALYLAIRDGRAVSLPPLSVQYPDYAIWQRERMNDEELSAQLGYWIEHLKGAPAFLDLPSDWPRSRQTGDAAGSHEFDLSELRTPLAVFNRTNAVTPFMTMLAVFAGLLRYLSGAEDLVVGADVANRPRSEFEPLIGFFINLVALRIGLHGNPSFVRVVENVREVTLSAYDHQELPFDRLVEALRPERNPLHAPIFQVKLVFHNVPLAELDIPGLQFEVVPFAAPRTELDLVLHVHEGPAGLRAIFEYRSGLFEAATIGRFAELFRLALRRALSEPDIGLDALVDHLAERDGAMRDAARAEQLRSRADRLRSARRKIAQSGPGASKL